MSLFPTGQAASRRHRAIAGCDAGPETDGVLIQPISGQIYLIEESDLRWLTPGRTRLRLSGLISRH